MPPVSRILASRAPRPAWLLLAGVLFVSLYIVKSRLGIDLVEGPSLLHDWLYPLVRLIG